MIVSLGLDVINVNIIIIIIVILETVLDRKSGDQMGDCDVTYCRKKIARYCPFKYVKTELPYDLFVYLQVLCHNVIKGKLKQMQRLFQIRRCVFFIKKIIVTIRPFYVHELLH